MLSLSFSGSFRPRLLSTSFTLAYYQHANTHPFSNTTTIKSCRISSLAKSLLNHNPDSIAIVDNSSKTTYSYKTLLQNVAARQRDILSLPCFKQGLKNERIFLLYENNFSFVATLLAVLFSQAIAVPTSPNFPQAELKHILKQSQSRALLHSNSISAKAQQLHNSYHEQPVECFALDSMATSDTRISDLQFDDESYGGLIIYTSGTTNKPKGVFHNHFSLDAQILSLTQAWKYSHLDYLLHVLPLNHIHGLINALLTPLHAGSTIEFCFPFEPIACWNRFAYPFNTEVDSTPLIKPITFFTAVPTIYNKLLDTFNKLPLNVQKSAQIAIRRENLRLNISGSASLPTSLKQRWSELSRGNNLLERYGMTEIGMALSCSLNDAGRIDASVGWPLPNVEVRLVDIDTKQEIHDDGSLDVLGHCRQGEIHVRGPTLFKEYWNNPIATAEAFVDDEDNGRPWFRTGDVAERRKIKNFVNDGEPWVSNGAYFIQGRISSDIIKSGGEKISALEIERELLELPEISECAVIALPNEKWGQIVAAVVVLSDQAGGSNYSGKTWGILDLRKALKSKLANYKLPRELKLVNQIPRNEMGKVNKKDLVKLFQ